jgi:hypothetical protein
MRFSTNAKHHTVDEGVQVLHGTAVCDLKGERAIAGNAGVAVSAIADGTEAVALATGSRAIARGLGARAIADGEGTTATAYKKGAIAIGINGGTARAFEGATKLTAPIDNI